MNRVRKSITTVALAAALAFGGTAVAQTATAAPAHAYTDTSWKFVANCMPYPSAWLRWRDYNPWEEFWGARDQWVFSHYVYRYC